MTKSEEKKEFTCSNKKCKKEVEEVFFFTPYGNAARKEESLKGTSYCESCFLQKDEELS